MVRIANFFGDRKGNFGILTALMLVPVIGIAGLAVDFGSALLAKSQLQAAAHAAAIGALTQTSEAFAQAVALPGDGEYALSDTEARKIFSSQSTFGLPASAISVDIVVKKQQNVITSAVSYRADVPTTLLNIIGESTIPVIGIARSTYQTPTFFDIYMLLDNTPSMGLGATPADMALMRTATKHASYRPNCAFACHVIDSAGAEDPNDHYHLDRQAGAVLRIDEVTRALKETILKVKNVQVVPNQVRMSAYTMGLSAAIPTPDLVRVIEKTLDLDAFAAATSSIELMTVPRITYGYGLTDFNKAIEDVAASITSVGTGIDKDHRQPVFILVGDGLTDNQNTPLASCTGVSSSGRCMEPLRTSYCEALKQRGIIVAVLHTTYIPVPEEGGWNLFIAPYYDKIAANAEACASPGYFLEVSPTEDIAQAMDRLFGNIIAAPRLTQ